MRFGGLIFERAYLFIYLSTFFSGGGGGILSESHSILLE